MINLDGTYKDLDWSSAKNVKIKFTDLNNTGKIKLFTYNGTNINYPKITVQSIGASGGNVSLVQNVPINGGSINSTPIGQTTPSSANFTNVNMSSGNIINTNTIEANSINLAPRAATLSKLA